MLGRALRAGSLTLLGIAGIGAWPADAGAQGAGAQGSPEHASLHWVRLPGSEACIGAPELAQAVEKRLGRPLFASPARAELAVEGHVAFSERGFEATLAVARADGSILGTRDLGPVAACRELDEPLSVVIALLIDPDASPAPEPKPKPEPGTHPLQWSGHGGAAVLLGPLPAPAVALEVGLALGDLPSWHLEATYVAVPWGARVEGAGLPGKVRLHAGMFSLCRDFVGGEQARMGGCVVGQAGVLSGEMPEIDGSSTPTRLPLVSTGLRARAAFRLFEPLWFEASGDAFATLVRPRFVYTALNEETLRLEQRELWRALPVGLRAAARLVVVF